MQGLEISKRFWTEYGKPLFEERFPEYMEYIAVGLVGQGSECYGFDDEISRDHDFEAGFFVFLPDENTVDRRTEFLMERAYNSLPKEFMGLKRSVLNPVGGNRHGIIRTAEFYEKLTGISTAPTDFYDYLKLPDYALCEVTNGIVFYDGYGEFSKIRNAWLNIPTDIIYKKICGYLIVMSQTGEYNFNRCIKRNDMLSASLTANEFINAVFGASFYILGKPVPYYKWRFKAMENEDKLKGVCLALSKIVLGEKTEDNLSLCIKEVLLLLKELNIPDIPTDDLQKAALALNSKIQNPDIRNLNILSAI